MRPSAEGVEPSRGAVAVVERVARIFAICGCVWFALAAAWGMFGAIGAGHYAVLASYGIIADNMLTWGTVGPVWQYVPTTPTPADWYCHHPFGTFWTTTILRSILGRHDWVLPLPAILMSAATPPLLYKTAKEAWGTIPASAAVLGFVFLPITLGFAHFNALEVPGIFGFALFFYGHARMLATSRRRHLVISLVGAFFACGSDWAAWLVLAVLLAWGMLRAFTLPAWMTPPVPLRRYATWWAYSVAIALGMLALWVALFLHAGKLADWLGSGTFRSQGGGLSNLGEVLASRKFWIESSFVPHTIFLGKVAAVVAVARLIRYRRDAEVYSLAVLFGASVQYVVFKHGADIHIFWPHYFGAYYALALAQLSATAISLAQKVALPSLERVRSMAGILGLVVAAGPTLVLIPDGMRSLRYARETGGRFNEKGHFIRSDMDAVIVGRHIASKLPDDAIIEAHPSASWGWHHMWATNRPSRTVTSPQGRGDARHPVFFARASGLGPAQQMSLAANYRVEVYDDVWVAHLNEPPAPLQGFTLEEREPTAWEWYFLGGVEPVRTIVADPFVTWEWRAHLDQPASLPETEPRTLEQKRIAHNIALSQGDQARADQLRAEIEAALSQEAKASFTQGLTLLGTRHLEGVEPKLELWFHVAEPLRGEPRFRVQAVVEEQKAFSFIPPDPVVREVAPPPSLSPKLWKPGWIYKQTVVLRQRIGKERFFGWFEAKGGPPPVRLDRKPHTDLLVLP